MNATDHVRMVAESSVQTLIDFLTTDGNRERIIDDVRAELEAREWKRDDMFFELAVLPATETAFQTAIDILTDGLSHTDELWESGAVLKDDDKAQVQ